jgi:hypothetical protein
MDKRTKRDWGEGIIDIVGLGSFAVLITGVAGWAGAWVACMVAGAMGLGYAYRSARGQNGGDG